MSVHTTDLNDLHSKVNDQSNIENENNNNINENDDDAEAPLDPRIQVIFTFCQNLIVNHQKLNDNYFILIIIHQQRRNRH